MDCQQANQRENDRQRALLCERRTRTRCGSASANDPRRRYRTRHPAAVFLKRRRLRRHAIQHRCAASSSGRSFSTCRSRALLLVVFVDRVRQQPPRIGVVGLGAQHWHKCGRPAVCCHHGSAGRLPSVDRGTWLLLHRLVFIRSVYEIRPGALPNRGGWGKMPPSIVRSYSQVRNRRFLFFLLLLAYLIVAALFAARNARLAGSRRTRSLQLRGAGGGQWLLPAARSG